jgi:hypothetical protein
MKGLGGGEVWPKFESAELLEGFRGQIRFSISSNLRLFTAESTVDRNSSPPTRLHLGKQRKFSVKIFESETSSSSFIACVESIHLFQSSDFYSFASVREANNKRRKKNQWKQFLFHCHCPPSHETVAAESVPIPTRFRCDLMCENMLIVLTYFVSNLT